MDILVFKTNITDSKRISDIESDLNVHPNIIEWNVDLQDCDNILRILSNNVVPSTIETILFNAGYYCEALE